MKRKKLPTKKHKGLYIYCSECCKYFSWTQKSERKSDGTTEKKEPPCGNDNIKFSSCKSFEKHRYRSRVHIPGTTNKTTSRTYDVTQYKDAVIKAIEFADEFKSEIQSTQPKQMGKRHYLFDVQIQYIDFLDNIGVPEHQQVKRSERHIKEVQKSLILFNEALSKKRINKKTILFDRITDDHVGYFHTYLLKDKEYSSKTYNNKIGTLRSFFKWAIEKFQLQVYNPFDKVKRRTVSVTKDTITKKEFKELLEIISPENGIASVGLKQTRNRYKPYLKDGIELALHTGGRREEVVELKWNMIKDIDNEPTYIAVRNLKVERQVGDGYNDNIAPKIIPITKSLKKLLYRMGYETKKGLDQYLLSPDRSETSTYAIMDNLSKGFSHFYQQLDTGRKLQLKSLRKTYLTYLSSALSGDAKSLSSHSTDDILQKHYIDEKVVNKAVKNLDIFE